MHQREEQTGENYSDYIIMWIRTNELKKNKHPKQHFFHECTSAEYKKKIIAVRGEKLTLLNLRTPN